MSCLLTNDIRTLQYARVLCMSQGDRKAGPLLSGFNYESVWGQHALKHMYRAVLEEEVPLVSTTRRFAEHR